MKLQRFFIKGKAKIGEELVVADPALSHQLSKVLRMKAGDKVVLFDGDGSEYVSVVEALKKDGAVFRVEESSPSIDEPKTKLLLYPSMIKKDKLEWVIQKCTELGVTAFHPVISDRSEKLGFDEVRMKKIATEAAEQSKQRNVPEISLPVSLEEAVRNAENPYFLEGDNKCRQAGANIPKTISIFVGPEGGWTKEEKEFLIARGVRSLSLGDMTLRAETASVAVSALLLL